MSKKSIGFKVHLGFDDVKSIADVLHLTSAKFKDMTTEFKFTGIEIVDNQDFSYTIMFNFDDELSIDEILDKVITGANQ